MSTMVYSVNPLMTEERAKYLMLPNYGVGKRHADPESGSSGDSVGAGSMSSGSSSSGSPFFRSVSSSKGASDISSDDVAVGETQKAVDDDDDDDDNPEPDFSRRVRIYVEAGLELVEKGSIGMYECKGYYTFARELRGELEVEVEVEDDDDNAWVEQAHVVAPWAPQYQLAEYYAPDNQDEGGRVSLNPLELLWSAFSSRIDYVIMRRSEVNGVTFALIMDDAPLWELNIPAFLLGNREYFLKIAHFFLVAHEGEDPGVFGKRNLEFWLADSHYSVRYLDEAGLELHYMHPGEDDNAPRDNSDDNAPGDNSDDNARENSEPGEDDNSELGEDDNSESGESFVAGDADQLEEMQRLFSVSDEESAGEIVDDQGESPENAAAVDAMDIELEVATGGDADQEEAEAEANGDDGWTEVSASLARIEFIPS